MTADLVSRLLDNRITGWELAAAAVEAAEELERLRAAQNTQRSSMQQFTECGGNEAPDPIERLRFFCSLAMSPQDWLDVEQFFIELERLRAALSAAATSLETIATQAGKDEFLDDVQDIRGYAANRAAEARKGMPQSA